MLYSDFFLFLSKNIYQNKNKLKKVVSRLLIQGKTKIFLTYQQYCLFNIKDEKIFFLQNCNERIKIIYFTQEILNEISWSSLRIILVGKQIYSQLTLMHENDWLILRGCWPV